MPGDSRFVSPAQLPVEYREDALCPGWLQFLNEVLPKTSEDDRQAKRVIALRGSTTICWSWVSCR